MAGDGRSERLKKWFRKAETEKDIIDRFIYGWLAMTIAANIEFTHSGIPDPKINDRKRVIHYFKKHSEAVETAAQEHNANSLTLSKRMGPEGGVILDALAIQEHCKNFRRKVLKQGACSSSDFAEATAEILNRIRNNLFHGSKLYDDTADRTLLGLVTPILLAILATSEGLK